MGIALRSRWTGWILGFCFWTLLGLSFARQYYISSANAGLEVSWKLALGYALGDWYVFAILSVPVISLARRLPFETGGWGRNFAVHLLASAAFSAAYIVLTGTGRQMAKPDFLRRSLQTSFSQNLALQSTRLLGHRRCEPGF